MNKSAFKICYKCISERITGKAIFTSFTKEMPFDMLIEGVYIHALQTGCEDQAMEK